MRSVYDLTTEEAYKLATQRFGHTCPPLDAIENEDWGRDYVLQLLRSHSDEELAVAGLTWNKADEEDE
jgi:hypothetical protein